MTARANPVALVAPGERGEILLERDVRAFVVRGARPGPTVWAWAARGDEDPSMAQALGELRDRLDARRLAGAVGLLLDGPQPPLGREQYPWTHAIRAICDGAAAVVLLESLLPDVQAAPHVALDLDDKASRKIARALGAGYLTPHVMTPAVNRAILTAPTVTWLDGEWQRLSRPVIDRAERALRSLLATLGMIDEPPARPAVRVVLKAVATVEAPRPGVAEPAVAPGAIIRLGEVAAWLGEPGVATRQPLRAPATGVVLYTRAGRLTGGSLMGIGKLRRALPAVVRAGAALRSSSSSSSHSAHASVSPPRVIEVGWCERVALPELGVDRLRAKIDTGARTCALHVLSMRPAGTSAAGRPLVDVEIPAGARGRTRSARVEIAEYKSIRDSSGRADRRPVIETTLSLGGVSRRVRVSLTDRGDMLFPMLVGRTALGAEFRVAPHRRFLLDKR
ncbi:MAG TPA: RimK/LysX family protein [Polyangia bacterium]|nr:RimK/LysX family protein [Polyangia bacterium]